MIAQLKYFNIVDELITMWDSEPKGEFWKAFIIIDESNRMRILHPKQLDKTDSALLERNLDVPF